MIRRIELTNFKNFSHAALDLGPLTVLVGANASGKSNIRDAFRFLHGISRGYNLSEVIGEKWGEGGVLQWKGIRGGTREVSFKNSQRFGINVHLDINYFKSYIIRAIYAIEVLVGDGQPPRVSKESLRVGNRSIFKTVAEVDRNHVKVQLERWRQAGRYPPSKTCFNNVPILSQVAEDADLKPRRNRVYATSVVEVLSSFRFLDLSPSGMRNPSLPGQDVLGDRGENLSSVLQAICQDVNRKETLLEWVNELTPMDARDFEFPADLSGKVLLTLVEDSGLKTTANSASDGTLRFLAMIAALLGPESAKFYFFEELENGIHPTRLALLLELIERQVATGKVQVVATTHSPQFLGFLSESALEHASLVHRLEGRSDAQIKRLVEIPDAQRLIKEQNVARLLASGWFENVVEFLEDAEVES